MQIRRLEDFDRLHQETLIREGSNRFPTEYTLNGITYDVSGMSRVQKVSLASLMNICGAELSVLHSLVMRANDADNSRMSLPKDSVNRKELERELLGAGIISMHYCLFVLERQLKIIAELDAIIAGRHDKHKTPRIHDVNRLWRSIRPHQTAFLEELNKLNPYHQFSKDKLDSWFRHSFGSVRPITLSNPRRTSDNRLC